MLKHISLFVFCALFSVAALAQVSSTRTTSYDWQCQDASGARISDHQREGTAIVACVNAPNGAYVQGGRYRITKNAAAPVDCAVSAWSAWSAGAWSACSGGQQSRTETRTRTVTTQPANGGTACPALTETRTATQACSIATGTATLSWTPPTQNTDGTTLANLAGYRISYGTNSAALAQAVQVASPGVSTYTVSNLTPGTWYFSVRAYTSNGNESTSSNVASKVVP